MVSALEGDQSADNVQSAVSVTGPRGELPSSAVPLIESLPLSVISSESLHIATPAGGRQVLQVQGGQSRVLQSEVKGGRPVVSVSLRQVNVVCLVVEDGM